MVLPPILLLVLANLLRRRASDWRVAVLDTAIAQKALYGNRPLSGMAFERQRFFGAF